MSYDWEDKSSGDAPKHTCQDCLRTDNDGAFFKYYEVGVTTPPGFGYRDNLKKLPMKCTKCWDELHQKTGVPYHWLDLYVCSEGIFDFYSRACERKGGDIESLTPLKQDIIIDYIKKCDYDLEKFNNGEMTQDENDAGYVTRVDSFVESIAVASGVHVSLITSGSMGFMRI